MAHHSRDCFHVSPVLPGDTPLDTERFLWKSMPVHFNPNSSPRRRPVVQVHVATFIHAAFPGLLKKRCQLIRCQVLHLLRSTFRSVRGSWPGVVRMSDCSCLYFHGGGRHLAKIPHCFAYKSFCFTAVLFALNVLLFQQLFIEPLYLQRGIARASGQSYQRIDSCGGGLCRDSFPSFDSVYQARSWSVWTASAFISAKQQGSIAKLTGTNTRLFFGKEFL